MSRTRFQKSTKRETKTKSFVKSKKNSRAEKTARLLPYMQKFLSVDVWIGLCENSHNAKAKNPKRSMKVL